jgi:hypothetical protein
MENLVIRFATQVQDQPAHPIVIKFHIFLFDKGHAVAQWLRHCVTNRKVAGSIPDSVRIFH